jgi:hypothetical protein
MPTSRTPNTAFQNGAYAALTKFRRAIPEEWVARCMRFGRPGQRAGFCTLAEDLRRPVQRPTPPPPGRGGFP